MSFKALQYIKCAGEKYAPGDIIPGAASFPNLKEMIEHRYIGYAEDIVEPTPLAPGEPEQPSTPENPKEPEQPKEPETPTPTPDPANPLFTDDPNGAEKNDVDVQPKPVNKPKRRS